MLGGVILFTRRGLTGRDCVCIPLCITSQVGVEHLVQDTHTVETIFKGSEFFRRIRTLKTFCAERRTGLMGVTQQRKISLSSTPWAPACDHDAEEDPVRLSMGLA